MQNPNKPKKWKLPNNVHSTCALGSVPSGGLMRKPSRHCPSSEESYQRLYHDARKISDTCDICNVIDMLTVHNMTLSLWGDSVQLQVFDGLHCALERQGYKVQSRIQRLGRTTNKITQIMTLIVNDTITIQYFAQYKPRSDPASIREESLAHIQSSQSQILFFNFGMHWNYKAQEEYRESMNATLTALRSSSDMLLIFRETSVQHFDTESGEYPLSGGTKPFSCKPLDHVPQWRDQLVEQVATDLGYHWIQAGDELPSKPFLVVAPFRDFSAQYYDLHPDECTHFCYSPHLYIPLWKSLRLTIERHCQSLHVQKGVFQKS